MPHIRKSRKNTTRHSRKSVRKTNKHRKSNKRSSRKMRGGCGCDKQEGGSATDGSNLADFKPPYPLSSDNQIPNTNLSSTFANTRYVGGKHKKTKYPKKMKGGSSFATYDGITTFGTTKSTYDLYNMMNNVNKPNSNIYQQPVAKTYSLHSPPLV